MLLFGNGVTVWAVFFLLVTSIPSTGKRCHKTHASATTISRWLVFVVVVEHVFTGYLLWCFIEKERNGWCVWGKRE